MANLATPKSESSKVEDGKHNFIFSEEALKKSADKISEYFDTASDSMKKFGGTVKETVEQRPFLALGGALLVGYVAGYLIKKITAPSNRNSELMTH